MYFFKIISEPKPFNLTQPKPIRIPIPERVSVVLELSLKILSNPTIVTLILVVPTVSNVVTFRWAWQFRWFFCSREIFLEVLWHCYYPLHLWYTGNRVQITKQFHFYTFIWFTCFVDWGSVYFRSQGWHFTDLSRRRPTLDRRWMLSFWRRKNWTGNRPRYRRHSSDSGQGS